MTGNPETFLLTRDKLLGILRLSMYSPSTRTLLPLAINLAASGNYQPLLGLYSLIMNGIDLAAGMHNSVVCAEDVHRVSPGLMADIEQSYTANSLYEAMVKSCSVWPSNQVDEKFFNPIESDIPTLLLSGELDPATPPDWGALAMVNMTNAAHFVAPYATHGVAAQTCGSDLVADLVDLGTVTDLDASCLSETHSKSFYLNPSSAQALQSKTTVEDSL
jgi:pimeloyl-ACP methyl ester carboxylesterase